MRAGVPSARSNSRARRRGVGRHRAYSSLTSAGMVIQGFFDSSCRTRLRGTCGLNPVWPWLPDATSGGSSKSRSAKMLYQAAGMCMVAPSASQRKADSAVEQGERSVREQQPVVGVIQAGRAQVTELPLQSERSVAQVGVAQSGDLGQRVDDGEAALRREHFQRVDPQLDRYRLEVIRGPQVTQALGKQGRDGVQIQPDPGQAGPQQVGAHVELVPPDG